VAGTQVEATNKSYFLKRDNSTELIPLAADDAQCIICFEEYTETTMIVRLPCAHHFHAQCGKDWLLISKLCPLCKEVRWIIV
jgi:hypothetical protein